MRDAWELGATPARTDEGRRIQAGKTGGAHGMAAAELGAGQARARRRHRARWRWNEQRLDAAEMPRDLCTRAERGEGEDGRRGRDSPVTESRVSPAGGAEGRRGKGSGDGDDHGCSCGLSGEDREQVREGTRGNGEEGKGMALICWSPVAAPVAG